MIDPFGLILTTIRDNPAVYAISAGRWAAQPGIGWALGAVNYQAYGVLSGLGRAREKRVPIQEVRLVAKCYAATPQLAAVHAGAVSDAIHNIGPRHNASGVLIYQSFDDGSDGAGHDPDPPVGTGQPYESVVISITAATVPMV